jgi:hypothetical protein
LRRKLTVMPARLISNGRRLRAPDNWPWRPALERALTVIAAIPRPADHLPSPSLPDTTPTHSAPDGPGRQALRRNNKTGFKLI